MDRLEAMRAFVAVADARGFAAAARKLGWSPPSVTRAVANLEDELSIRLMQRTTRAVSLTGAGARYLERARRILADVDEAEQAARAERIVPAGRLVVAAPNVFGRREVAPLLSELLTAHHGVTGELVLADRMVDLVEEGFDLAIRIGVLDDSSLHTRPVGATRRVVVASPSFLARERRLQSPRDLASLSTIQFAPLAPAHEWRFFRRHEEERVIVRSSFVTNSADVAIAHATRGGGLAMVLSYQVRDELRAGVLEIVLARFEPPPLPIQIVFPSARLLSAAARAFIDLTVKTRDWNFVEM